MLMSKVSEKLFSTNPPSFVSLDPRRNIMENLASCGSSNKSALSALGRGLSLLVLEPAAPVLKREETCSGFPKGRTFWFHAATSLVVNTINNGRNVAGST